MHSALHLVLEICLQYTPVQLQSWSITSMPNPVAADIYMCQVNLTSPVTTIIQTIKTINFSPTVKLPSSDQPEVQRAGGHV